MLEFGRIVLTRQAEQPFLTKDQTDLLMLDMEGRLSDKDDAVRQQAVHDVCDMAFQVNLAEVLSNLVALFIPFFLKFLFFLCL